MAGETGRGWFPLREGSFGGMGLGFEFSDPSLPAGETFSVEGVWKPIPGWYTRLFDGDGASAERGGSAGERRAIGR
jgi:hypothetical protein